MPVMPKAPKINEKNWEHEKIGVLSPVKQEVWVNPYWPTNVISSFDSIETFGNRIDFVCKTQFNHDTNQVDFL